MKKNTLFACFHDSLGVYDELEGESLEEMARDVPEDHDGSAIEVRDEAGSLRGWLYGRDNWRAA